MPTQLDRVLEELKRTRGIDFSGYRRNLLERRLAARMGRLRLDDPEEYLNRLRTDPAESDGLIDAIAINISCFFRNPVVWEITAQSVLPEVIERRRRSGSHELRVWSAGTATGEEAYSIAILIHEALKGELGSWAIHVFATDIDEEALRCAVAGIYPREWLECSRLGILDQYFSPCGPGFEVRPFIRRMVWFSREDLTSPKTVAPAESIFGTFDLVFCRNVLIYFARQLQDQVLSKLWRCLAPQGYLILGDAESLNREMQSRFELIDRRNGIYKRHG